MDIKLTMLQESGLGDKRTKEIENQPRLKSKPGCNFHL